MIKAKVGNDNISKVNEYTLTTKIDGKSQHTPLIESRPRVPISQYLIQRRESSGEIRSPKIDCHPDH